MLRVREMAETKSALRKLCEKLVGRLHGRALAMEERALLSAQWGREVHMGLDQSRFEVLTGDIALDAKSLQNMAGEISEALDKDRAEAQ
jgi:hypothetical protein